MTKVSVTFRLDAELAARLKDAAAKSGGKLTQVEIVESALADKFAIKDSGKLLAKVNESQQTALTLVKEQSQAIEKFQSEVGQVIVGYKKQVQIATDALDQTVRTEMRGTTASVNTLQQQMANMTGTLRQIEDSVQRTAETRLSLLHWLGLFGLVALAALGVAALGVTLWQRLV